MVLADQVDRYRFGTVRYLPAVLIMFGALVWQISYSPWWTFSELSNNMRMCTIVDIRFVLHQLGEVTLSSYKN